MMFFDLILQAALQLFGEVVFHTIPA